MTSVARNSHMATLPGVTGAVWAGTGAWPAAGLVWGALGVAMAITVSSRDEDESVPEARSDGRRVGGTHRHQSPATGGFHPPYERADSTRATAGAGSQASRR